MAVAVAVAAASGMLPAAEQLDASLRHPYWERPIPAQGEPPGFSMGLEFVADLSAASCGICHLPQYRAWQGSWHARAVSPGLLAQLEQLSGAEVDACLACHAPREEARRQWWREGLEAGDDLPAVDCTSCHVRSHRRHGPRGLSPTPHAVVEEEPLFREAAFCAPCHQFDNDALTVNGKPLQNTYREWLASDYAKAGVTCQDCHMPEGRHEFKGVADPEMVRQGLRVEVWRTAKGMLVLAGNQGAGHALPTYVTPQIEIALAGSQGGRRDHLIARRMRWSEQGGWEELADNRLLPGQWISLDLALQVNESGQVRVRVDPGHDYHQRIYPFLLERWSGQLSPDVHQLFSQAREDAAAGAYLLDLFHCPPRPDAGAIRCANQMLDPEFQSGLASKAAMANHN